MDASDAQTQSLFRTHSWVQSWIDVWGGSPALTLIDLGGRNNPLEYLYLTSDRIKGILPVRTLCLAGTGFGPISTPRAEYNDLDDLHQAAGGAQALLKELKKIRWKQWCIPDFLAEERCHQQIRHLSEAGHWPIHQERNELGYEVVSSSLPAYQNSLSANTRRTYFNQRKRLRQAGLAEREAWPLTRLNAFIDLLNHFHAQRWGKPCFSEDSRHFLQLFLCRLEAEGGTPLLEVLTLNGRPVSVLLDIVWRGTRHNLQSGFSEKGLNLSLGALHMGFAVEDAIHNRQHYDFLAGRGKVTNYKARLANKTTRLHSVYLQKRDIAFLRKVHSLPVFGH